MQDRFKFRVWHKERKLYIDNGLIDVRRGVFSTQNLLDADKFLIEQCTGLKDKNGKLIYEGDIVKCGNNGQFIYKVGFNKRFASFVLIRKEDAFNHYFGEAVDAEDVEVIGNIHENPELLENKDE